MTINIGMIINDVIIKRMFFKCKSIIDVYSYLCVFIKE